VPSNISAVSPTFALATLVRAASDPRLVKVAQVRNLNLHDLAALGRLLTELNRYLALPSQGRLSDERRNSEDLVPGQSAYVRNALRIYREIDAMK
jgi:hypothetical protein